MNAVSTTINFRASASKKALIDEAASVLGKNRTEFILETLSERAHEIFADRTQFRLNRQQIAQFNRLLDEPVNDLALQMLAKPAPWET